MILLLDTSTPTCKLSLVDGDTLYDASWEAGRSLAHGLLRSIDAALQEQQKTWADIVGIGVFQGPGSFTGLRIGLSVANTIADSESIPIVGSTQNDWRADVLARLRAGDNDSIVLPYYGSDAHITKPRK